eukprot:7602992-Pyramimonas_sp.AAC.1
MTATTPPGAVVGLPWAVLAPRGCPSDSLGVKLGGPVGCLGFWPLEPSGGYLETVLGRIAVLSDCLEAILGSMGTTSGGFGSSRSAFGPSWSLVGPLPWGVLGMRYIMGRMGRLYAHP